ncbi:restriction endonuclease subunit S [Citrobacter werkmanii]|uniref:restriction endonuclease subunit S n=1 Tax=Citrobacter werkmanii TaxID=67827 RepID=UPI00264B10D4|nr:restriction endonuclease subunit S [Citrobacter werkmanii]MDN8557920.1 restriction endonuclease subunit S [Citrobacter werkmanii]
MSGGKLPEGWVDTQLGNIVDYGKATKRVLSDVNDDTWVLELEDIEKESSKLLSTIRAGERPFKSTKNSFKKGDVLYGKLRPYLNKIIIAEEDGVCTTEIIPLSAEPSCCNKYIFYWLKSSTFLGYVNDVSYGVNMPRLGTADGLKAPLRLAPLAEQKIIAEKLDTLLAQVDSTKARLEQIPQILKRFRQAVLAMALNGSSEQSRNPAKIVKLIDVTKKITDGEHLTPKTINSGIPLLSAKDVQEDELLFDNVKYLSDTVAAKALNRCNPEKNDILIVSRGATVGRTHLVSTSKTFCLMGSVLLIKLDTEQVIPEYMKLIFNDISGQQQLVSASGATAQQAIYIRDVKEFSFKLISLHEQHEIVRRVEQLFAYADTIEKQVNNALARVNSLTQSILAKAFRGELTAQWRAENPDLISGENSAAALLEKIKAERAASGGKKTSRKKA